MGALPRPELPAGAHRNLLDALHDLHHRAGWPSLRRMAAAAEYSHTTVSATFTGERLPSWDVLAAVVHALDGDVGDFHRRWLAATSPEDQADASRPALAGRREELAIVASFLQRSDGVLLVLGEAGIGKTSLVEAAAAGSDRTPLAARCLPLSRGEPMMPITAVLRAALRRDDGGWLEEALAACAPFVRDSVSVLLPELGARASPPEIGDGARQRLFTAVSMTLAALARARPTVVVLDDLHWADATTLGFVEYLLAYGDGPPLVGAWRVGDPTIIADSQEWRTRVTRLPSAETLRLGPLTRAATAEQLGLLGVDDAAAVDRIHTRSEGLPLFTEQLARHGGRDEALPHGLAELLALRLDGLSEPAHRIENTLGVMNRPLEAGLLPVLTGLGADEVSAGLHELDGRYLLRSAVGEPVALGHPLLCEAVRRRMFATELAEEHHRVATALESLHRASPESGSPVSPAEIAEHWQGAGEPAVERAWRVRAAQAAQQEWGLIEAAAHWRRAFDLWPPDLTRLDDPPVPRSTAQLAALRALGAVDWERGHQLAEFAVAEIGDRHDVEAAEILRAAGTLANMQGDLDAARDLLERAIAILRQEAPSVGLFEALFALSFVQSASGWDHDAAVTLADGAELSRRIGATSRHRLALSLLAWYAVSAGDGAAAARYLAQSAPCAQPSDEDPGIAVRTALNRSHVLLCGAAPAEDVLAAAAPGFAAARQWGGEYELLAILRENAAEALRVAGRVAEAAELLDSQDGADIEKAMLDVLRGRPGAAMARARAVAAAPRWGLDAEVENVEKLALVAVWVGEPAGILDRTLDVLDRAVPTDAAAYVAPLLVVAARATADTHTHHPGGPEARRAGRRLAAILEQASQDPFATVATMPDRPAYAAQWAGELARLHGRHDPAPWATAARRWDRLTRPHDAAYCRWRAAEAAAANGQGTQAARLARRALTDARAHEPLRRALATFLGPGTPA